MGGKRFRAASGKVDRTKRLLVDQAFDLLVTLPKVRFDETVDVSIRLGVDPKQTDQMVRGTIGLPHGLGKETRVIAFVKGEKQKEAKEAGAVAVGAEELIEKINGGWMEFDKAVATPDLMAQVSKLGKILGPRGLMPNPKLGTVSLEVGKMVRDLRAGKAEFKIDKGGVLHSSFGKISFGKEKLRENFATLMGAINRAKPQNSKGVYLKSVTLSTTMGPGIKLDPFSLQSL